MMSSYLLCVLADRVFGVKLTGAIEILPWRQSRRVPLAYSFIEGLLDYRGAVYPVHNLARLLGLSRPGPIGFTADDQASATSGRSIILLEERGAPFGIVVDSVLRMTNLEDPAAAPEKAQGIDPKYIKGFSYDEDREIMILNFERLLHAD